MSTPHDTLAGRNITLKGTSTIAGPQVRATWNFGDGSAAETFPITNAYDVSIRHVYYGAAGTVFRATLSVNDAATGESGSADYLVAIREKSLDTEVNIAIDEGLWYLHKTMNRTAIAGQPAGTWQGACGAACDNAGSANAVNVLAFERHGYLESGDSANPYTETVGRALKTLTDRLQNAEGAPDRLVLEAITAARSPQSRTAGGRTYQEILQQARKPQSVRVSDLPSHGGAESPAAAARYLQQLALAGVGRPDTRWVDTETALRNLNNLDLETHALYQLSEAMRSHAPDGVAQPLAYLHAASPEGVPDLDWYGAEISRGDATDGVARILVNRQNAAGDWSGHASGALASSETADALLTLSITPVPLGTVSTVTNVTSSVSFNFSGNSLGGSVTVTNVSGSPIPGPLALAVFEACTSGCAPIHLFNQSGTFNGDPYVLFGDAGLGAGESAVVPLEFAFVGKDQPAFAVYSGTMPPSALNVTCPNATAQNGTAYSSSLVASGGVLTYTYSTMGSLPAGLNLNASTGAITGTPTANGAVNFIGVVTDSTARAPISAVANCTITVTGGIPTNTKPAASATPPSLTVLQNSGMTPVQLNGSDTETAAANLRFTITLAPASGTLRQGATVLTTGAVLTGGSPATISYQPNSGFTGSDSFRFKVTDRGAPDNCGAPGPSCAAALDSDEFILPITVNPVSGGTSVTNVTSRVNLNFSFGSSVLTVSNLSASPIPGPLTVGVFFTCPGGSCGTPPLLNQTGVFNGDPYLALTVGDLNPGQSVNANLLFPAGFKLNFGTAIYSGVFPPASLAVACPSPSAVVGLAYSSSLTGSGGVLPYTFSIVGSLPAGLSLNTTTGAITGTPTTTSSVTFTAGISDSAGRAPETASTSCTINVSTNVKPTGSASPLTILEDAAATAIQLTGSDTETPAANLTFTITQLPANGTLREGSTILTVGSVLSTGSPATVTYQPNANFNGSDSFQFKVTDRGNPDNCTPGPSCAPPRDSDPVTASFTITPVNDPPSFTLSGTPQRAALSGGLQTVTGFATTISAGPPDEAGQTLTFVFTGNTNPAIFASGPAIAANGTLTYTPAAAGTSTLTVVLQDNGGTANGGVDTSAPQTFTITVNTPPAATAQTVSTAEDTALPITLAGSDVNGDALTYSIVTAPAHGTALPASGAMTCAGTPSACTAAITYTPAANFNGADAFTFRTNDGLENSTTVTVTITVTPVNDAPVATPQTTATPQATAVAITLAGTDIETPSANLVFSISTAPAHGSLTGTAPNLTYTPAAGYFGPDSFQFTVTDRGDPDDCGAPSAGCSAALTSTPATVSITVSPVNTPPTANNQTVTVQPNTPKAFTLSGTDAETASANLTYIVTGKTSHGTLTGTAPNLTYTPYPGFTGTDDFTFFVIDRGNPDNCGAPGVACAAPLSSTPGTVTIVVQVANTAPVANGQIVSATVDTPLPITLTGSDAETAAANLTFTITLAPVHGTLSGTPPNVTYTPNAGYIGPDIFQFKVTDRGSPDNCGAPGPFCAAPLDSTPASIVIIVNP